MKTFYLRGADLDWYPEKENSIRGYLYTYDWYQKSVIDFSGPPEQGLEKPLKSIGVL
jgi:hypothetical protein